MLEYKLIDIISNLQAWIKIAQGWLKTDFMQITPLRFGLIILFVATASLISQLIARQFYAADDMPPPFRNMDMSTALVQTQEYLDAQGIGPNTVLILGDCVAYGHGATKSFTHSLKLPNYQIVNLSMQSFNYNLMLASIDYAYQKGVRNIIVQLHPFHNYLQDAQEWYIKASRSATEMNADELVDTSRKLWRDTGLAMINTQRRYSFHEQVKDGGFWSSYSAWLRSDLLGSFALYRNRYILDATSDIDESYFSFVSQRIDSYVDPLSDDQQVEILERDAMQPIWNAFVIRDQEEYESIIREYSPQTRISSYARQKGINTAFVMVPTFVDKVAEHTNIRRKDLEFSSSVFREIATQYDATYLDYLSNETLSTYMYHYDNLTAEGQKIFGKILEKDLNGTFAPRSE
ncbi:hypothetical protein [Thalassospira australica]|uniref:hypothetical protein n=1 Tax=Thalassospira australica TaxID=1528106 RepID=UPI000519F8E8|nr:hypothetical protein [Thalassospira australica]